MTENKANVDLLIARFEQRMAHKNFADLNFMEDEFNDKYQRGREMLEWFSRDNMAALIEQKAWAEVGILVTRAFTKPGPMANFGEYQWARYLSDPAAELFATALFDYLHGSDPFLDRLERFVAKVTPVYLAFRNSSEARQKTYGRKSLTWPFVSYFRFLMWPEPEAEHPFLKPGVLKTAAKAAGFELDYDSTPNAETYVRAQEFYRQIWPAVKELGGRNWIDVQTVIHVAGGGFGKPEGGWIYPWPPIDLGPTPTITNLHTILKRIKATDLVFPEEIVTNYYLSLRTKRFVILTGLSGTGKTKLTRTEADAVHDIALDKGNPYYALVAVQPDWTDSRGLLGYFNPLTQTYATTRFLRFLLRAAGDPGRDYFLCLDEMNLARVEYYFSDFLSAMESGEPISLHFQKECVATASGEDEEGEAIKPSLPLDEVRDQRYIVDGVLYVPPTLFVPKNLHISGTVNVDETTHAFSDKVLDRANSIEFAQIDLTAFEERYQKRFDDRADLAADVIAFLSDIYKILEKSYLHFGYRTVEEILEYMAQNETLPKALQLDRKKALDNQLMQKVLPKLRGDERIASTLAELRKKLVDEVGEDSSSVHKLDWMIDELETYGSTHFWR